MLLARRASGIFLAVVVLLSGCGGGGGQGNQVQAISVVVTGATQANVGTPVQYSAVVTGTNNTSVTWSVNNVMAGNTTYGTITAAGLYTPPATVPTANAIVVTATSMADATRTGTLGVTIYAPTPVITAGTSSIQQNGSLLLDVKGTGFLSTAVVQANSQNLPTTFVSSTELTAVLATPPAQASTIPVQVVNPNPGSTQSVAYNLPVAQVVTATAATRLLEQTTFGPTDALIAHVQQTGLSGFLDEQFAAPTTSLPTLPNPLPAQCTNNSTVCNDENWWGNILTGNDQLRQRVAFALSQIFVISYNEVSTNAFPPYVNNLASDAFGNWTAIMKDVTLSPGMGIYLNMVNSGKPAAGAIANENFARENMQLFNLGLNMLNSDGTLQLDANGNPIPTYTELQVQAFAKVFTGWTFAKADGTTPSFPNYSSYYGGLMVPVASAHDATAKTLLSGMTLPAGQTPQQDLDQALQNIFQHQNVGPFVCRQLIEHLVTSNPSPQYVKRVSAVFADNGSGVRGDMKAVLKAIFLDQEARAGDTTPGQNDGHLREPILWTTNVLRALNAVPKATITDTTAYNALDGFTASLSEIVFRSPSVFNFFPPDYGVPGTTLQGPEFALETTATSMQRLSIANSIVSNSIGNLTVDLSRTSTLGQLAVSGDNALLDELNKLFLHGTMSAQTRTTIENTITSLTDPAQKVRVGVYLVITSTDYKVMH